MSVALTRRCAAMPTQTVLYHARGALTHHPQLLEAVAPHAAEAAWRLGNWDSLRDVLAMADGGDGGAGASNSTSNATSNATSNNSYGTSNDANAAFSASVTPTPTFTPIGTPTTSAPTAATGAAAAACATPAAAVTLGNVATSSLHLARTLHAFGTGNRKVQHVQK